MKNSIVVKRDLWRANVEANKKTGLRPTVKNLVDGHKGLRAIVVAAGPTMHQKGLEQLRSIYEGNARRNTIIVACDGSLPLFGEAGYVPDYVVSVDGSPIVSKFYWRDLKKPPRGVLLATTVHPSVTQIVREHGWKIYWWQPLLPPELEFLKQKGLPSIQTGGNVGTSSWVISWGLLKCLPIGLLGIEFSWSDETPLMETQYYQELYKALDGDFKRISNHYVTVWNPIVRKRYIADPVYYTYMLTFKDLLKAVPARVRNGTYSLTREGIMCKTGIKYTTLDRFLAK